MRLEYYHFNKGIIKGNFHECEYKGVTYYVKQKEMQNEDREKRAYMKNATGVLSYILSEKNLKNLADEKNEVLLTLSENPYKAYREQVQKLLTTETIITRIVYDGTGLEEEAKEHNKKIKEKREIKEKQRQEEKEQMEKEKHKKEEEAYQKEKESFLEGERVSSECLEKMCAEYGVDLHMRTVGRIRKTLLNISCNDNGEVSYTYQRHGSGKTGSIKVAQAARELYQKMRVKKV